MDTVTLSLVFLSASQAFNLPPGLLSALCYVESHHRIKAVNQYDGDSASHGICQIKEATARHMGFQDQSQLLLDPNINIYYAAKYLSKQIDRYDGDIRKAVAAYNAGSHKENAYGVTRNIKYVNKVFKAWADDK